MTINSLLIITVNWNSGDKLEACVNSFLDASKPCPINLMVVDNSSEDGSDYFMDNLLGSHDCLHMVRSEENLGFGNGCNLGVETAGYLGLNPDFILFLNPDTILFKDTFETLTNAECINDLRIGIIGVQIYDNSGVSKSCSYFPSLINFWSKSIGIDRLLTRIKVVQHHMKDFDHLNSREVDQVMGAFLMIRNTVFTELKGFDPQFFVYFEEVDLCYRAKKNGYKVWFESQSKIWHYGGGTTENFKATRLYLSISSRLRFFLKNKPLYSFISIFFLSFTIELIARVTKSLVSLNYRELKEIFLAYTYFLTKGIK